MNDLYYLHPSSDLLDRYAMNQLPESQAAYVEEHMLLCPACCRALTATESDIKLMKAVLASHETTRPVWVRV